MQLSIDFSGGDYATRCGLERLAAVNNFFIIAGAEQSNMYAT